MAKPKKVITHWYVWEDCSGESKTRFYRIYNNLRRRCNNHNSPYFSVYGWKWIKNERKTYKQFKEDMYESYIDHVNKYWELQTSIDRIDNNWNYCKENCRWATWREQNCNKSKSKKYDWKGKKLAMAEIYFMEKDNLGYDLDYHVFSTRLTQMKMSVEDALKPKVEKKTFLWKWEMLTARQIYDLETPEISFSMLYNRIAKWWLEKHPDILFNKPKKNG